MNGGRIGANPGRKRHTKGGTLKMAITRRGLHQKGDQTKTLIVDCWDAVYPSVGGLLGHRWMIQNAVSTG